MSILLLDTGILGRLCHPNQRQNRPVTQWLSGLLSAANSQTRIIVPEISDYELRRKLLHLVRKQQATQQSIDRLNALAELLDYLPLTTGTMRAAAELWADARAQGVPTGGDDILDGDVILAAQAHSVGGTVVTTNPKHLARLVSTKSWADIEVG
jgi:predicted nucleic acid-binding protein